MFVLVLYGRQVGTRVIVDHAAIASSNYKRFICTIASCYKDVTVSIESNSLPIV